MHYSVELKEESAKGAMTLTTEEKVVARITFSRIDDNNVIVDHTAVDPGSGGEGHGTAAVEHIVDWARKNDQKILPLCPFAKAAIEKHQAWQDVLRKNA